MLFLVSALIFGFIEDDIEGIEWPVLILIIAGFFINFLILILKLVLKIIKHKITPRSQTSKVSCEKVNLVPQRMSELDLDSNSPENQNSLIKSDLPINNEISRLETQKAMSPLVIEDINSI